MLDEGAADSSNSGIIIRTVIRTGCLSCRANGIKCDLDDPSCQRHISTKWTSKRKRPSSNNASHLSNSTNTTNSPSLTPLNTPWQATQKERESLHFFCMISAPELSGFLDSAFWQRLVPQATHLDHAIKHAAAAIGASHQYALRRQVSRHNAETDALRSFSLSQCNKAINHLLQPSSKTEEAGSMRALTMSILFASFDALGGNKNDATPHIVHSRRLVESHKKKHKPCGKEKSFPIDLPAIEPLVVHYETQVGSFIYEEDPEGVLKTFNLDTPLNFETLADARIPLEQAIANFSVILWSLRDRSSAKDRKELAAQKSKYSSWLKKWDAAFAAFLAQHKYSFSQETLDGCRLLAAHHKAITIAVDIDDSRGEEGWKAFTPHYRTIVELIGEIVENLPKHKTKGYTACPPQVAYVNPSMGMTEPLYCAATRCADPSIAKRARELIGKLPPNEGVHSKWKIGYIEKSLCATTGKTHPEDAEACEPESERLRREKMDVFNIDEDYTKCSPSTVMNEEPLS